VPAPPSAPPPSPALPAAAAVPTPTPAPAPAPAPSSSPAPSPAPASAQPRGPSPVAVALARTAPPASPPPAADGESFVVQVGTFSSRANATRLAQQLSEKGLSARVSPFKGGATELYRVRVGPAGDRAAAVTLLARVKAAGSGGTVVPNLSQAAARP
jgi:cell division protein FtsN